MKREKDEGVRTRPQTRESVSAIEILDHIGSDGEDGGGESSDHVEDIDGTGKEKKSKRESEENAGKSGEGPPVDQLSWSLPRRGATRSLEAG